MKRTPLAPDKIRRRRRLTPGKQTIGSLILRLVLLGIGPLALLAAMVLPVGATDAQAPAGAGLPAPQVPQPQFFCGYCHVLTYPGAVQKGYDLWKQGKHKDVGCVACHYPPERAGIDAGALTTAEGYKDIHIPKKPPQRFSYLSMGGEIVRTRPRIVDASCMTAACHGNPKDQFKTKKIQFTEKVAFTHEPHLDPKKQIEGQQLNCVSCHQHETNRKKFEVTKTACHVCHFTNAKFNRERAKCALCHELPQKPIQTSGEKPITHKMLQDAGVACASCHIEVIEASGGGRYQAFFEKDVLTTALVLGAGSLKPENCRACHDKPEALSRIQDKKEMHAKHVTVKNARCLDCHRPITHAKADLEPALEKGTYSAALNRPVEYGCQTCHPDTHRYQKLLAAGPKQKGVLSSPDPMFKARTNCMGCHTELKTSKKGMPVLAASGRTCVQCHTKDHAKMLDEWKSELVREVKDTREVEQEALDLLQEATPDLTSAQLAEARAMIAEGRRSLNVVVHGNGVHNKKYSIMLIDAAITAFEDMLDYVDEIIAN